MSAHPKDTITAGTALDLINSNETINNVFVSGKLSLAGLDNFDKEIVVDGCVFEFFEGASSRFLKLVKLTNSQFILCDFTFTYFLGGLEIENCVFESYLDFQSGGHNINGNVFSIRSSTFKKFVNFFDCWYESAVIIESNDFRKGTNLLGKGIKTTFDVKPKIENNKGKLDIDDEGDVEEKADFLR